MSATIKSSTLDEVRLNNYRAQIERKLEHETKQLEAKHGDQVNKLIEAEQNQLEDIRHAYDVRISQEAEALEERLQNIRAENQKRIDEETQRAKVQLDTLKDSNEKRLKQVRAEGEAKLLEQQDQYQISSKTLHEKSRMAAQRQRELANK